ncbi:hypothetical protein CVT24_007933 [Panaeolus cyanescens]|uniref:SAP domain-containing protein n=1 Tax=Panaeolus cyanescens TaxID=181874 RepID=A0A409X5H7_9AGAR|nr:hypothetical protein CVT24_007933 [Panaeolus cyanescens]
MSNQQAISDPVVHQSDVEMTAETAFTVHRTTRWSIDSDVHPNYEELKHSELKSQCKQQGLKVGGNKYGVPQPPG